jgi:5S rRNA maturation endonuclease (ribonuclease M5)
MKYDWRNQEAIEELKKLFIEINQIVDITIVEGNRDVHSLKRLGYKGKIITCNQLGLNNYEFISKISKTFKNVLILTDYDKKGQKLYHEFSLLLEKQGIKVEHIIRQRIGKLTAFFRVYAIEDLDNVIQNLKEQNNQ